MRAITPVLALTTTATGLVFASKSISSSGLSYFYGGKPNAAVFEPFTVQGYPAVIALARDTRADGDCTVEVGVSDTTVVQTTITLDEASPKFSTSCDSAKALANGAITTLKSGG